MFRITEASKLRVMVKNKDYNSKISEEAFELARSIIKQIKLKIKHLKEEEYKFEIIIDKNIRVREEAFKILKDKGYKIEVLDEVFGIYVVSL